MRSWSATMYHDGLVVHAAMVTFCSKFAPRTGPAQVATDEYRRNWDAIWNQSATKPKLMN